MITIGITGGVGSGKSEVMAFLREYCRCWMIFSDDLAREMMEPGGGCFRPIAEHFGDRILAPDGKLDRGKLASVVFRNPDELAVLNAIVHPAVKREIIRQIIEAETAGNADFFFLESALLIEEKYDEICDELWYVYAEARVRRKRLAESRMYTDEKITAIMENQLPEAVFRGACDFTVDNSGSFSDTKAQIERRLERYI